MEKITLFACGDYPNIEVEFKEVDMVGTDDIYKLLEEVTDSKVIHAQKDVVVSARPAVLGEEVDTRPRCVIDGKVYTFSETMRTISQKDIDSQSMLVQNPDGEVYVVKGEKFARTYQQENEGEYRPVDGEKKFVTITENICFKAPWGEMTYAPAGSKLCIEYLSSRDVYSVTNSAFDSTYQEAESEAGNC